MPYYVYSSPSRFLVGWYRLLRSPLVGQASGVSSLTPAVPPLTWSRVSVARLLHSTRRVVSRSGFGRDSGHEHGCSKKTST